MGRGLQAASLEEAGSGKVQFFLAGKLFPWSTCVYVCVSVCVCVCLWLSGRGPRGWEKGRELWPQPARAGIWLCGQGQLLNSSEPRCPLPLK